MGHYNFKTTDKEAVEILKNSKNMTKTIVDGLKNQSKIKEGLIPTKVKETPKMTIESVIQ